MTKKFSRKVGLLAIFAAMFVLFSCDNGNNDTGSNDTENKVEDPKPVDTVYYSVSDVRSAAAGSNIVLAWTNPAENWDGVKISISPAISTWNPSKIYKTESTASVPNAENGTKYTITFTTVKSDGSATDKVTTIEITTPEFSIATETPDTTAPGNVTNLNGIALNGGVMLTWTDATDNDIFGYEVSYEVGHQVARSILPMRARSVFISQETQSCFINALTNETEYKFTVKTMDTSGNKSVGSTTTVTTPAEISKPSNTIAGTHLFGSDTVTIDDEEKYIFVTRNGITTTCTLERTTENNIEKIIIKKGDEVLYTANIINKTIINIQAFENGQMSGIPTPTGEFTSSMFREVANYNTITSFAIPNGYTSIGNGTFRNLLNLKSITIPDSVKTIGEYAFQNTGLLKVELGSSIESIGKGAFRDNSSLETIKIESGEIGTDAFQNCVSVKTIEITSGSIGESAFRASSTSNSPDETKVYKNTVSLTLGNGVIAIKKNAFRGVPIGETLIIPDSVTEIGECAFDNRQTTTNSTTNTTTYYNIKESKLKKIVIGKGVKTMGRNAFAGCNALTDVVIEANTIGEGTFRECPSLKNITIGRNVETIGEQAFYNSKSVEKIILENGNTNFVYEDGVLCNKDRTVFLCRSENVQSITFGSSYKEIPADLFRDNLNLETVTFTPDCRPTKIGRRVFNGTSIKTITIPSSVTEIGEYAFAYCSKLETINVESGSEYFTSEDGILYNKDKTEIVCYPAGKAGSSFTIPNGVKTIGYASFVGNENLETVTIEGDVEEIVKCAFMDSKKLATVTIGSSVVKIGKEAFRDTALTSATFSDPTGWWYASSATATEGTTIDADYIDGTSDTTGASTTSLSDPATAAEFLKKICTTERYWFKN